MTRHSQDNAPHAHRWEQLPLRSNVQAPLGEATPDLIITCPLSGPLRAELYSENAKQQIDLKLSFMPFGSDRFFVAHGFLAEYTPTIPLLAESRVIPASMALLRGPSAAMNTTSVSLLERLKQPAAQVEWRRFVSLYTPLFYFWARRLGLHEQDAADLVQEVFVVLLKRMASFDYDRKKSFRGWLRTVLHNKWRERLRAWDPQVQPGNGDVLDRIADSDVILDSCEAEYQRHLSLRALQLMQAEFQPTTWKACWEHVVCEREAAEVARELGITVNAVYLSKSRVLRRLRQEFAGMLD
jgi:RNA polymerase sigma-70 factor (ECF subfamily)